MADYPGEITTPRTMVNKDGVAYDAAKTKIIYAEDFNKDREEIVAIETELGTNPKGVYASVAQFLEYLENNAIGTPVATIISSAALAAPNGFLACNGASISRTTYADLYAAITEDKGEVTMEIADLAPPYEIWTIKVTQNNHGLSTGDKVEFTTTGSLFPAISENVGYPIWKIDANSFWICDYWYGEYYADFFYTDDDTQSGTHSMRHVPYGVDGANNFMLPDMRGMFVKGAGENDQILRAVGDTYFGALGAYEYDGAVPHKHQIYEMYGSSGTTYGATLNFRTLTTQTVQKEINTGAPKELAGGEYGNPRVSRDMKPANISVNYFIKY